MTPPSIFIFKKTMILRQSNLNQQALNIKIVSKATNFSHSFTFILTQYYLNFHSKNHNYFSNNHRYLHHNGKFRWSYYRIHSSMKVHD